MMTAYPGQLVRASEESGSWQGVGVWLAASLNHLDRLCRGGAIGRSERATLLDDRVHACRGERTETDVVVLPDGTRVCWHLARTIRKTRWIVENRGDRCAFGG